MTKCQENARKWFFRRVSGIFSRKNKFFENRALSHFRYFHFASVRKFSWKNIKYSSKNSRNTVFPAKVGCSSDFLESREKTTKYKEKVRTKSAKTAISGIFPAFSAGKKFFSKIGLGHILGIPITHLCAKNQKKQMMKSRESAKKPVFPAHFRHFWPEKNVFRKSGSVTFKA